MRHAVKVLERSPALRDAQLLVLERRRIVECVASEWMVSDDERRVLHFMSAADGRP